MDDFHINLVPDLDNEVGHLTEVQTEAKEAAEKIARVARETAPVQDGDYRDGIVTQQTRTGYRVVATDQKSAWIEFGIPSRNVPAKFNLRRAVESAGYRFKGRR